MIYDLYDDHVAKLLEQAVSHVEHLRLGQADRAAAHHAGKAEVPR